MTIYTVTRNVSYHSPDPIAHFTSKHEADRYAEKLDERDLVVEPVEVFERVEEAP